MRSVCCVFTAFERWQQSVGRSVGRYISHRVTVVVRPSKACIRSLWLFQCFLHWLVYVAVGSAVHSFDYDLTHRHTHTCSRYLSPPCLYSVSMARHIQTDAFVYAYDSFIMSKYFNGLNDTIYYIFSSSLLSIIGTIAFSFLYSFLSASVKHFFIFLFSVHIFCSIRIASIRHKNCFQFLSLFSLLWISYTLNRRVLSATPFVQIFFSFRFPVTNSLCSGSCCSVHATKHIYGISLNEKKKSRDIFSRVGKENCEGFHLQSEWWMRMNSAQACVGTFFNEITSIFFRWSKISFFGWSLYYE